MLDPEPKDLCRRTALFEDNPTDTIYLGSQESFSYYHASALGLDSVVTRYYPHVIIELQRSHDLIGYMVVTRLWLVSYYPASRRSAGSGAGSETWGQGMIVL